MSDHAEATSTAVVLPGVGTVLADLEAGTLTPFNARSAVALGLDKPAKQNDDRFKQLLDRRRVEAYATNKMGRPAKGWVWNAGT